MITNSQLNVKGDNNGITIGDNNDFSIVNNIIINIDQRGNLKSKHDHEEHEFDLFCIEKARYGNDEKSNVVRVLCTNIYSGYEFIADHAFICFPKSMYDETWNFSLIKVKGIVYKYIRKNETEDYSFVVTDLLDMSNRIIGNLNNSFKVDNVIVGIKEHEFNDIINKFTMENLYDVAYEQMLLLDTKLSSPCSINQGFISGFIMTRYFLNTKLQLLINQKNALRKASREVLIDLIKLFSYIIQEVDCGNIFTWKQFLCSLNKVCNYFQGVCYDFKDRTKDQSRSVFKGLDGFRNKIQCEDVKKIHGVCRTYNQDTGYDYPENEEEFENGLMCKTVNYFIAKRYIKLEENK